MTTKTVCSARYYPTYYGRQSTNRSYRSYRVGDPRPRTADQIIGYCDASEEDGWIAGIRGAPAARSNDALYRLAGFKSK